MAKHSVNVLIKARDEASRKFLRIGGAAKIMGSMLKGVGSVIKTAFVTALKAAKYAAVALTAALAACTWKMLKQEAAEVELASALKVTNQYSDARMKKLKAEAAEIQDVTTYGDEYIMTLQRMAITLGVTEDKATDAAKAAIALHAGFGGGRGKPEIFLRYYIDALRGTGTSLASYVGELRKAKTEQEKMLILQKAMAKGWDVAKSKAESGLGVLAQTKNKLGDIAEVIAAPLLPMIKSSGKAVTAWAKENEANIAWWAQKTFSYVTLVKDVFWDFVVFMKQDWRAGLAFAFGSFLELLKATFKSAVILAIAGGRGIWKGVKEGLLGEKGGLEEFEKAGGKTYKRGETWAEATEMHGYWKQKAREKYQEETFFRVKGRAGFGERYVRTEDREKWERALQAAQKKQVESIIGGSLNAAANTFKEAIDNIFKDMPDDLRKGYDESLQNHMERLEELGAKPGKTPIGEPAAAEPPKPFSMAMAETMKEAGSALAQKLAPLEARFLTFKPGATFDIERRQVTLMGQNVQNTKNMFQALKDIKSDIKALLQEVVRQFHRPQSMEPVRVTNFG